MSEPDNLVLAHLRELRADIEARFEQLRTEMDAHFDAVDTRFDRIEQRLEIIRNNGEKKGASPVHRAPGDGGAHHGEFPGRSSRP